MLTSVVQVAHNSSREQQGRAGSRFRLHVAPLISLAPHSQIGTQPLDCRAVSSLSAPPSLIAARLLPGTCSLLSARQLSAVTSLPWPPWRLIYGSAIKNSANLPRFSDMQNSNRRHIAYFSYDSSHHLSAIELRRQISNSNIRHFRNSSNSRKNNTYVISNSNKTRYSWNHEISILPILVFSAPAFRFPGIVRSSSKSVRIRNEMAVSPQPLGTQSGTRQDFVDSVNPCTGDIVVRVPATPLDTIPGIFEKARTAQKKWAARPLRERCEMLRQLADAIFERRDDISGVITRETGKPRAEAILAEVLLALDTANFLARQAPRWLRPERVPHHNIALK